MTTPTPGSDPNQPQAQQGWGAPAPGYDQAPAYGQAYPPAPGYAGQSAQRPGMVTAAGVIGIVWGALGLLFGLLALSIAFDYGAALGLIVLLSTALSAVLLWAGIQVVQNKSPRLLLLVSYVALGVNLISMIWTAAEGGSWVSGLLGLILPGVIIFLLRHQQSRQWYAGRGISY